MLRENISKLTEQLSLPVISAPMFLVSSPELVVEGCKSGIIGTFPVLNARTTDILEDWMKQITAGLAEAERESGQPAAPWGVNLIVHRTNKRYEPDLELIKKYKPPIVITSLGNPQGVVSAVHEYGGLVFSDVATLKHARRASEAGVDGLILVCNGAGGHAGTLNPVAFLGEVKEFWDGITIVAGCISRGRDILAMEVLGADLVYMGTRFIAATESSAGEAYQKMLLESNAEDLVYTDAFSGVHANYLVPSIQNAGLDPDNLQLKETMDFSFSQEKKAWKDIWSAGQGVGAIKETAPISKIVSELKDEYEQAYISLDDRTQKKL